MAPRGRPPKKAAERRSERLVVKLTPAEMKAVKKAAGKQSIAVWVREWILTLLGRK